MTGVFSKSGKIEKCCCWDFIDAYITNYYQERKHIPSRFSNNSEAYASELLENLEDMFSLYYMQSLITKTANVYHYII